VLPKNVFVLENLAVDAFFDACVMVYQLLYVDSDMTPTTYLFTHAMNPPTNALERDKVLASRMDLSR